MEAPADAVVNIDTSANLMEATTEAGLEDSKSASTLTIKGAMYDINDPPDAAAQFAMFPDRAEGNKSLVYILMKTDSSKEHLPIVLCADCVAPKWYQYCNGAWEYLYQPCTMDKDL
jgi:hypothetical protein